MIAAVVIAVCLTFILYVMVGWPILLGLIARISPKPVAKSPQRKTVSVLIAVHNGETFLKKKLESVMALEYPKELIEVFVLSDGSTDSTEVIASQFPDVEVVRLPRGGKCSALNEGFKLAHNEILLMTDARQQLAPDSLQKLVDNFADPKVGVVSGDLLILKGDTQEEAEIGVYWRYESWIRRQLSRVDSMFGATGPFYTIRRDLAVRIPTEILLDDMYLPLSAFFKGYRLVVEEGAKAYDYPTSLDTEFRRKVRTLAGNWQLLTYYPGLLGPGNRMWFHYVSCKLGRLLLPYALIAIFIASLLLPSPENLLAIAAQFLFYGLAWADSAIPQGSALKKLTSPIRTFSVMMAATLFAVSVFFVPPQSLWKVTTKVGVGKGA